MRPGNHVLTLRSDQVVSMRAGSAGDGIPGKGHASTGAPAGCQKPSPGSSRLCPGNSGRDSRWRNALALADCHDRKTATMAPHLVGRRLGNATVCRCGRPEALRGREDTLWGAVMSCCVSNRWPRHIKNDLGVSAAEAGQVSAANAGVYAAARAFRTAGVMPTLKGVHHAGHGDEALPSGPPPAVAPWANQAGGKALAKALKMLCQSAVELRRPSSWRKRRQTCVVMVKPGGTWRPSTRVISARLAPLPPSS